MANPVLVAHVEARFRPLSELEAINAEAWIEDVWSILLEHRPDLETDLDDETITENAVIRVVSEAVIRKLQNPDGKIEERGDDYGFKRHESTADGRLYVPQVDLTAVTPDASRRTTNSVRLVAYGDS